MPIALAGRLPGGRRDPAGHPPPARPRLHRPAAARPRARARPGSWARPPSGRCSSGCARPRWSSGGRGCRRCRDAGSLPLSALPPRSVVVAFSATRVYELAERIRRKRGGAAVVIGALSPRARNAQVALFQSGEVDTLVATDAIGMGLNLDVDNVVFADLRKFDGREAAPAGGRRAGPDRRAGRPPHARRPLRHAGAAAAAAAGRRCARWSATASPPTSACSGATTSSISTRSTGCWPRCAAAAPRPGCAWPTTPRISWRRRALARMPEVRALARRPARVAPALGGLPDPRLPPAALRRPLQAAGAIYQQLCRPAGRLERRLDRARTCSGSSDRGRSRDPAGPHVGGADLDVHHLAPRLGRRRRRLAGAHPRPRGSAERRPPPASWCSGSWTLRQARRRRRRDPRPARRGACARWRASWPPRSRRAPGWTGRGGQPTRRRRLGRAADRRPPRALPRRQRRAHPGRRAGAGAPGARRGSPAPRGHGDRRRWAAGARLRLGRRLLAFARDLVAELLAPLELPGQPARWDRRRAGCSTSSQQAWAASPPTRSATSCARSPGRSGAADRGGAWCLGRLVTLRARPARPPRLWTSAGPVRGRALARPPLPGPAAPIKRRSAASWRSRPASTRRWAFRSSVVWRSAPTSSTASPRKPPAAPRRARSPPPSLSRPPKPSPSSPRSARPGAPAHPPPLSQPRTDF